MADINFEPNYAELWNRTDLPKTDIIWMLFGINPDDIKKQDELNEKTERTEEEQKWLWAFRDYWDNLDPFLGYHVKQYNELLSWKDNKKQLVQDAYEFHFDINQGFLDFLGSIGDIKRNKTFESYASADTYAFDLSCINIRTYASFITQPLPSKAGRLSR